MVYNIKIRNFELKISIFNLDKNDGFNFNFCNKFNEGMFGIVYPVIHENKNYVVKKILFRNQNQKSKQILNTIKQYAIMKIFSAFQAAPNVQSIYGFDLIINENSIIFSMQKGIQISKYFQSLQSNNLKQSIEQSFDDLRKPLLLLHSFNITHNDIKPENMVFSPSKNKLVFIDFGLSQVNPQKIGQMKLQKSKGSFYYCCQDMKQLFKQTSGKGYVDMYYNDFIGLQKSQKNLSSLYFDIQNSNNNSNVKLINFLNEKTLSDYSFTYQKEIISIKLISTIYFQKLDEIKNLISLQQSVILNVLNKYLHFIYIVFLKQDITNLYLKHIKNQKNYFFKIKIKFKLVYHQDKFLELFRPIF